MVNNEQFRPEGHNPTFGIIMCADTYEDIARYSSLNGNDHLFQAKYMLYMPTKEQLKLEIEREKEIYRLQTNTTNDERLIADSEDNDYKEIKTNTMTQQGQT